MFKIGLCCKKTYGLWCHVKVALHEGSQYQWSPVCTAPQTLVSCEHFTLMD